MERRRFSQTMASEWQTAFVVSHKIPWCALLTAVKNCKKSLENCKTFSSRPRLRTRPNVQDQDQDFHFCPRGASRPRPWSRGLHHCNADHAAAKSARINNASNLESAISQVSVVGRRMMKKCH